MAAETPQNPPLRPNCILYISPHSVYSNEIKVHDITDLVLSHYPVHGIEKSRRRSSGGNRASRPGAGSDDGVFFAPMDTHTLTDFSRASTVVSEDGSDAFDAESKQAGTFTETGSVATVAPLTRKEGDSAGGRTVPAQTQSQLSPTSASTATYLDFSAFDGAVKALTQDASAQLPPPVYVLHRKKKAIPLLCSREFEVFAGPGLADFRYNVHGAAPVGTVVATWRRSRMIGMSATFSFPAASPGPKADLAGGGVEKGKGPETSPFSAPPVVSSCVHRCKLAGCPNVPNVFVRAIHFRAPESYVHNEDVYSWRQESAATIRFMLMKRHKRTGSGAPLRVHPDPDPGPEDDEDDDEDNKYDQNLIPDSDVDEKRAGKLRDSLPTAEHDEEATVPSLFSSAHSACSVSVGRYREKANTFWTAVAGSCPGATLAVDLTGNYSPDEPGAAAKGAHSGHPVQPGEVIDPLVAVLGCLNAVNQRQRRFNRHASSGGG